MNDQEVLDVVVPLTAAAETAAALAARLRLDADSTRPDPAVAAALDRTAALAAPAADLDDLDASTRDVVVGTVTSFLEQALELIQNPSRACGWVYTDPVVLQAQGRSSVRVADLIATVAPTLAGLTEALSQPDARILDVGSGVAALTIACCRTFPAASVVGLEPWEPAMALGRANVAAAGLDDRIELRDERVEDLVDGTVFDLAWLPALFIAPASLDAAVARVATSLRPGGWLILGRYAAPDDPLADALAELRTVRGGGTMLTDEQGIERLELAGLVDVHAVAGDWSLPVRFVAGRRSA